jgi:hypothetical protein
MVLPLLKIDLRLDTTDHFILVYRGQEQSTESHDPWSNE